MSQTTADFLLARLREWDVQKVFGYPGDGISLGLAARTVIDPEELAGAWTEALSSDRPCCSTYTPTRTCRRFRRTRPSTR